MKKKKKERKRTAKHPDGGGGKKKDINQKLYNTRVVNTERTLIHVHIGVQLVVERRKTNTKDRDLI